MGLYCELCHQIKSSLGGRVLGYLAAHVVFFYITVGETAQTSDQTENEISCRILFNDMKLLTAQLQSFFILTLEG